ncbi:MAG: isoprenyl transferase [Myxococcales bacterium]|nr:isoprenyl transferase [Myxococcales bacterium]
MNAIEELESQVKAREVPKHVGIIMDGNGRWAESRGLPRLEGHREGSTSVREVTRSARRMGLKALTLYAFSSQNWSRPPDEVAGLMELLREYLVKERDEIMDNGIKLNAIGELDKLPKYVKEPLDALRAESAKNQGLVLTLALSYGGREELVHGVRALAAKVASGALAVDDITEETVAGALWTHDLPPVDLVIRSSGEQRLSNFLLWQTAYSEFLFSPIAWPDFRAKEFAEALLHFQTRERRFGLTGAQLRRAGT